MNSIFEQPRTIPKPTPVTQSVKAPVVPEASLIFQNSSGDTHYKLPQNLAPHQQSYNAWKLHNAPLESQDSFVNSHDEKENKEFQNPYCFYKPPTETSTNKSMLKKQVRFERPSAPYCSPNFLDLLGTGKPKPDKVAEYIAPINSKQPLHNKNDQNDSLAHIEKTQFQTHISRNTETFSTTINSDIKYTTAPSEKSCKYSTENSPTYHLQYQRKVDEPNVKSNERKKYSESALIQKYTTKYPEVSKYLNTQLDLSIHEPRSRKSADTLFEKTTLNSEGIKKFALPDHVLQKEKLKTFQTYNMHPIAQNLPPLAQNFTERISTITNRTQNLVDKPQTVISRSQNLTERPQNINNRIPNLNNAENMYGTGQIASNVTQNTYNYKYPQNYPVIPHGNYINPSGQNLAFAQQNLAQPEHVTQSNTSVIPNSTQGKQITSTVVQNTAPNIISDTQNNAVSQNDIRNAENVSAPSQIVDSNQNRAKFLSKDDQNLCETSKNIDCDKKTIEQNQSILTQDEQNTEKKSEINPERCHCKCNSENETCKSDPTVAELINIVQIQNQQLKSLQNQVQMLIKLNEKQTKMNLEEKMQRVLKARKKYEDIEEQEKKELMLFRNKDTKQKIKNEHPRKNIMVYKDERLGTNNDGMCRRITKGNILTKDNKREKISVGIMTSFQVSLNKSPYENVKPEKKDYRRYYTSEQYDSDNSLSSEERFSERNDRFSDRHESDDIKDDSLDEIGLEEELQVQEPPLSPDNTVHVDMQDYDSDSDDEDSSVDSGWTFYDHILGKVNDLLKNSPSPSRNKNKQKRYKQSRVTDQTMEAITQATIDNLKKEGFREEEIAELNPNEISFAVKQLLMKYMSDEDLTNIVNNQEKKEKDRREPKYQKQRGRSHKVNSVQHKMKSSMRHRPVPSNEAKILDITTLKKQPKLL